MKELRGFSVVFFKTRDAVDLEGKIGKAYPSAIFSRNGSEVIFPVGGIILENLMSHGCVSCVCLGPADATGKFPFYFPIDEVRKIKNGQGKVVYDHFAHHIRVVHPETSLRDYEFAVVV